LIFFERTLIEKFSADFDFHFSIAITIAFEMLNRIDRTLIGNSSNGPVAHGGHRFFLVRLSQDRLTATS